MLSLLSDLRRRRWFERVVQPMAAFELLRRFPLDRVNRDERSAAFANGQFMLFRRDAYERIGGHEAVRDELLEDLALARACRRLGLRWRVLRAGPMLACRMYNDWLEFQRGWSRILIEASRRKAWRLRQGARRMTLTHVLGPALSLGAIVFGGFAAAEGSLLGWSASLLGAGALLTWIMAMIAVLRAQGAEAWWVVGFPIGALLVAGLLRRSAKDLEQGRGLTWAGRRYHAVAAETREPTCFSGAGAREESGTGVSPVHKRDACATATDGSAT